MASARVVAIISRSCDSSQSSFPIRKTRRLQHRQSDRHILGRGFREVECSWGLFEERFQQTWSAFRLCPFLRFCSEVRRGKRGTALGRNILPCSVDHEEGTSTKGRSNPPTSARRTFLLLTFRPFHSQASSLNLLIRASTSRIHQHSSN